jgi:hypothetical protein
MKKNYILLLTFLMAGYWIQVHGQAAPRQGEILITEIMVNPEAVSDANGEWFEILNVSDHDLILNGLNLDDAGTNHHVMTSAVPLVLPSKGYWVLAKNSDVLTNGGVTVNYVYQNFTLSNTSDQVIITTGEKVLVDQVSYTSGWPVSSGASMELHPAHKSFSENDLVGNWLQAKTTFGAGDRGSPGLDNPVTSGMEEWDERISMDVFPNPAIGTFTVEASFPLPQSGSIRMINLLGQEFIFRIFTGQKEVQEFIDADLLSPGVWFVAVATDSGKKTTRLVIQK